MRGISSLNLVEYIRRVLVFQVFMFVRLDYSRKTNAVMDPDRVHDYCRGKTFIVVLAPYCYFTRGTCSMVDILLFFGFLYVSSIFIMLYHRLHLVLPTV